jgi:hypothetical protein
MTLSTVSAAKIFLVITGVTNPTVSTIPVMLEQPARPVKKISSVAPIPLNGLTKLTTSTINNDPYLIAEPIRSTTVSEKIIGEIRQWGFLKVNWDGEGASLPSAESIKDSVSFIKLIAENSTMPEPMLLASGNAGLYFNQNNLYVDIEFLGNNRISYFIKRGDDKHKGVLTFDNEKMPAVFQTLIWT